MPQQPEENERLSNLPPPLVAAVGWLVPGGGYWLIGEQTRGLVVCLTIVLLYILGLLIAGVRVVEVPGYDSQNGAQVRLFGGRIAPQSSREYARGDWALSSFNGIISEIAGKPWFAGQVLAGPMCLISAAISVDLAQSSAADYPRPHSHLETVGTLYTAIAGMLNLLVIIDAAYRAGQPAPALPENPQPEAA